VLYASETRFVAAATTTRT